MNNILVDFDLLVDKDYGLIQLIKKDYSDNDFIDDIIFKMKDKILLGELLTRKEKNPLSIIFKKDYTQSLDSLYNEFLELELDNILNYSLITNMLDLMITYVETSSAIVTVICKNKSEEQFINKYKLKTIVYEDFSKLDIKEYDSIFIKDYSKILEFKNLIAKNIFIGRYNFNLEDDEYTPKEDISVLVGNHNIVSIIDVYNSDKFIILKG